MFKFHSNRPVYDDMIGPPEEVLNWFFSGDETCKVHLFSESQLDKHQYFRGKSGIFQNKVELRDSDEKIKIVLMLESPAIYEYTSQYGSPNPYNYLFENISHFDYVMSPFRDYLVPIIGEEKFKYCPVGGSRIRREDFGLYEKERLVSIVASEKRWTDGHKLRYQVVQRFSGQIDTYGSGFNTIIDDIGPLGKIQAVAPYYFSFAIMNSKFDDYFTEVVGDCLAVGTIPIFWGSTNIGNYFNSKGIIQFENLSDLDDIMKELSPELYKSKIEAVKENVELAKEYVTHFEYIYKHYQGFLDEGKENLNG